MPATSSEIFGLTILEPVTLLTDLVTGIISFVLYAKLISRVPKTWFRFLWTMFFLFYGISTLISGFAHGLYNYTGHSFLMFGWSLGLVSVFFIQNATFSCFTSAGVQRLFIAFSILQLLVGLFLVYYTETFLPVTISTALGLLGIVFPSRFILYKKQPDIADRYIMTAIGIAFISAVVHTLKISFSDWFNHKDISHVILTIALYYFYKGAESETQPSEEPVYLA